MEKSRLIELLEAAEPCKYLNKSGLERLLTFGEVIEFSKDDFILVQGHLGNGLYVLLNGKMAVTAKILGKGFVKLAVLHSGQFFGEVNLLEHIPCTANVRSLDASKCFYLNKSIYDMMYLGFPEMRFKITKAIIENVLQRQQLMTQEIQELSKFYIRKKYHLNLYETSLPKKQLELDAQAKSKRLAYLKTVGFFTELKQEEFERFICFAELVELPNKHHIFNQKILDKSLRFILNGAIAIGIDTEQGYLKFAVVGPNKFVFPSVILHPEGELFHYRTSGPTLVLEISESALEKLREADLLLWYKIQDQMASYFVLLQKSLNTQIIRMHSEE